MTPKKDEAFEQYKNLAEASLRQAIALDNDYLGHMLLAELLKENPQRLDEAELLDPELDMVEMYRLLLNINKTRKLPTVNRSRPFSGGNKTKQPSSLKNVKKKSQ